VMDDTRLPMASDPSPSLANRPTLDIEDNPLHTISTAGVTNQDVSVRYVQDVSSLIGYGRHNGASIGELAAQFFAHWERFDATNQAATVHAAQLTPHGDGWKQCAANHGPFRRIRQYSPEPGREPTRVRPKGVPPGQSSVLGSPPEPDRGLPCAMDRYSPESCYLSNYIVAPSDGGSF
jgi:hypothetical protein